MNSLQSWNYEDSVNRVRPMVINWRTLTLELVEELYAAREHLRTGEKGGRPKTVQDGTVSSWSQYLQDVGLARTTVHYWLERYEPKERRLLNASEVEERRQIEDRKTQHAVVATAKKVKEAIRTGKKPADWDDDAEREYQREVKEQAVRDKRVAEAKAKMQAAEDRRKAEDEQRAADRERWKVDSEILEKAANVWVRKSQERQAFKERIRLSQSGESDQFVEALMDYLDELEDDNRRIEACQNIIKVCRNIAAELQREAS